MIVINYVFPFSFYQSALNNSHGHQVVVTVEALLSTSRFARKQLKKTIDISKKLMFIFCNRTKASIDYDELFDDFQQKRQFIIQNLGKNLTNSHNKEIINFY